ncbi:putative ATP-dependent endonuclease, OLD family [Rhodopirellula islandica]|uniref:ATP-dependent endonuclease, OLD family n=1 Tax=Rhodopirellula islandica TaxID=595434 RepID=A0A0J1BGN3_RHOIS|nr:ATP-binding protein [Rhodopirellula islandica]KLU05717.1 putative ATP-dependent endonuclease, OLD family [Rhodopirellula islandica]
MKPYRIKFKGGTCFKSDWAGFDRFDPINVIVGRNNAGKSRLLDFVKELCGKKNDCQSFDYQFSAILDEEFLRLVFPDDTRASDLGRAELWEPHGKPFLSKHIHWVVKNSLVQITHLDPVDDHLAKRYESPRLLRIQRRLPIVESPFQGYMFRQLYADRDIQPEKASTSTDLQSNGHGATNLVNRYLNSTSLPRELVQDDLLDALNLIFGEDGEFTEIETQHDDESEAGLWEIYLAEKSKGLIPLSQSGSGLKTIILVLLNILVIPQQSKEPISKYVFAFEELENNLHPALQRRLMRYLAEFARRTDATFFLTTHSNVTLDVFSRDPNSQIVHVSHDGNSARTQTVEAHFDRAGIVSELGAKPSDLLQANGVLWLEGPSDRIYLNRWIQLFSSGELVEGLDYQCAFYGGSVLARTQFASPEDSNEELANLLRINPNIAVVCDGDRTAEKKKGSRVKQRVQRIRSELEQIPGSTLWITEGKEIESYLTVASLENFSSIEASRAPLRYERIFPSTSKTEAGKSYFEKVLKRRSVDKIAIAMHAAPLMTKADLSERFELAVQVEAIVRAIRGWGQ